MGIRLAVAQPKDLRDFFHFYSFPKFTHFVIFFWDNNNLAITLNIIHPREFI